MIGRRVGLTVVLALAACSRAVSQDSSTAAPGGGKPGGMVPKGYGSLRRDDIVIQINADQVQLQLLPLTEGVIRLLAPDTYTSLSSLVASKQAEIENAGRRVGALNPSLALVTFNGMAQAARFTPENLAILSRGRLYHPAAIVPLTPTWSTQQLDLRQQAMAIYLFEDGINWRDEQLIVQYGSVQNGSWGNAVRKLDQEEQRVISRSQSGQNPPPNH